MQVFFSLVADILSSVHVPLPDDDVADVSSGQTVARTEGFTTSEYRILANIYILQVQQT